MAIKEKSLLILVTLPISRSIILILLKCQPQTQLVQVLSPPQRLLFFKKPRERGKGGKKGKVEKAREKGKSAREREKRKKPLPDFCRNMAPARRVVVHCGACMLGCGTKNFKNGVLKF